MNILYITTVFPEETDNSTIYTDLAERLSLDHNITVVTNVERKKKKKTYLIEERGCKVLRIKTGNQYNVSFIEKGISLMTLSLLFIKGIKKYLGNENFDLILYESPPVTLNKIVSFSKKKYKAKTFLMLKDIFPQNAVDLNILKKKSILYKYFKKQEINLYNISDKIGCMSEGNIKYIEKHNVDISDKLCIFRNTKKLQNYNITQSKELILSKYSIPNNKTIFIFGGNMGIPQGLEYLSDCIIQCNQKVSNAFFVLVGRGTEKEKLKEKLKKFNNNVILDNLNREEYELLLLACDVGIISLDYRFTIPNYPSRILSYMELKKPILFATDINTDIKNLANIVKCGLWCPSNSIENFVENVRSLLDKDKRIQYGKNGYDYMLKEFNLSDNIRIINDFMEEN